MTLKTKMSLLVFLTSLSIVSIGFSSWSITAETTAEINGNIEVDNVINSDKYVYLDTTKGENNTGIDCFKYQEYGYLNEAGTAVTDTAYINAYFTMDLEKCNELFIGEYKSIKMDIKLHYSDETATNLNLFKYHITEEGYQDISSECIVEDSNINTSFSETLGTDTVKEYNSTFIFLDLLTYYEQNPSNNLIDFEIKYSLFSTTGDYFYNNIFQYLYKDMVDLIDFELEVRISAI